MCEHFQHGPPIQEELRILPTGTYAFKAHGIHGENLTERNPTVKQEYKEQCLAWDCNATKGSSQAREKTSLAHGEDDHFMADCIHEENPQLVTQKLWQLKEDYGKPGKKQRT